MIEKISVKEIFGDNIIFRDMNPLNKNLPRFIETCKKIGLKEPLVPRKNQIEYATVLLYFLKYFNDMNDLGEENIIAYFGDADLDKTAISNLKKLTSAKIFGFICDEKSNEEKQISIKENIFHTNRWSAIVEFVSYIKKEIHSYHNLIHIYDLDKTVIGAKSRNSKVIDNSRLQAIHAISKKIMAKTYEKEKFENIYNTINDEYKEFTGDDQDKVAFSCIVLGSGFIPFEYFVKKVASEKLSFNQFFDIFRQKLEDNKEFLDYNGLKKLYQEINSNLGHETIFPSFRQTEFQITFDKIDKNPDSKDFDNILKEEITITQEVVDVSRFLNKKGTKAFLISDKPIETIIPSKELEKKGYFSLIDKKAKIFGQKIFDRLK